MDAQDANARMAPHTGLFSLPDELLFRIFGLLKDKELYKQIGTCHTFHNISLHIIFSRHHPQISSGKIYIHSLNSPTFLLPAIHGALFLHDLHDVSIIFASQSTKFFEEMRVLTEIVGRMKRNTKLSVDLKRVEALFGPWYLSPSQVTTPKTQYDHEQLADALQNLVDAALKKGCTTLDLVSSEAFKNDLVVLRIGLVRQRQLRLLEERKREIERRRFGFLRRLSNVFFNSRSSRAEESNTSPADASTSSSSNAENPNVPIFPSHLGLFVSEGGDPSSSRSLAITGPLFFSPFFLPWTLSLLNYGNFTKFSLNIVHFDDNPWPDILPKICMVNLKEFTFHGDGMNPYDLALFLQRHSDALEDTSLSMSRNSHQSESKWVPSRVAAIGPGLGQFSPPLSALTPDPMSLVDPLYLDFPVLRHLDLTSYHIPWFLDGITSNPQTTQCLPTLSALTISLLPDHPQAPDLDQVFESITKLINLENSGIRCSNWLSSLKLNAKGIKASVFLDSLNSYSRKHSNDTGTKCKPGMMFPTIRDLHLDFRYTYLDIFSPLLRLFALFPNVKHLTLGSVSVDALRMRRGAYWREVRVRCPELDEVVFENFRHLPAKMDDLVTGKYPCAFV